ncbi:hypothetical protein ZPAH1_orf00054 [Aeromonas phage ZPAH1]|nr:hypothetical protein ASwh1_8 [Aeromonas phage Aswh_1]QQG33816.1 hypothetical protein ZPAH1_orf00054 [Aeromonas phage ZPAH1]
MNHRMSYDRTQGVEKIILKAKKGIRLVQEDAFYKAVGNMGEVHKSTIAQSLKLLRKEHLGDIDVSVKNIETGIPRVEYHFKIDTETVLSMIFHGSERGEVYINALLGYDSVVSFIKEN